LLKHGGRLQEAAQNHQIPLEQWIDLSTGINPNGYPIPAIPAEAWQRLPEEHDGLIAAAQQYYQSESILAVAGSQAAIQTLPLLRAKSVVGLLTPSYAEHAHAWKKAGHDLHLINQVQEIDSHIHQLDTLILVNPNNPTGETFSAQQCLHWLEILNKKQGWLIIDEAFIDAEPELSLSALSPRKGLIILRSIGKFFGLAGIRSGFVLAEATILKTLNEHLGPWTLSTPSRLVTTEALKNNSWQTATRADLQKNSLRLQQLLTQYQLSPTGSNALFHWVKTEQATHLHQQLAKKAVFTRLFTQPNSLRFGLPSNETAWQQLTQALETITRA